MSRIFFLLNELSEFNFAKLIRQYLPDQSVDIGVSFPTTPSDYKLIILWNYRNIISNLPRENNVILFHSSDLPEGRGWAPIYHSIVGGQNDYVISGLFAGTEVDAGDIIVKARFPIKSFYMASDLRRFDTEISIQLIGMILRRFENRALVGLAQYGNQSVRKRRYPNDNRIDINCRFSDLVPHLRACDESTPAFFEIDGIRFNISITTSLQPSLPNEIDIVFSEDLF